MAETPQSSHQPVIVDTDPGVDDAIAILMLLAARDVDIVGLTTTAGNIPQAWATRNSLALLEYAERTDIPVCKGAARPIRGRYAYARHVHSSTGLTRRLRQPTTAVSQMGAVEFLARTLMDAHDEITLIALGPLTNLARLARRYPTALRRARNIIVMGGAVDTPGNASAHSEFNFYSDPTAAKMIIESGAPMTLIDLAACRQVFITRTQVSCIESRGRLGTLAAELLTGWFAKDDGRKAFHLYDPLAVLAATHPQVLALEQITLSVVDSDDAEDPALWGKCMVSNATDGRISVARSAGVDSEAALAAISELLDWEER